jgi:hypothetical protein
MKPCTFVKLLADRNPATDVIDNYDARQEDPRFERSQANPYLKAALTPAGEVP